MEKNCCSEVQACAGNVSCRALESCSAACAGDNACRAKCFLDNPVFDQSLLPAVEACSYTSCKAECGLDCTSLPLATSPSRAAECGLCVSANSGLCDATAACLGSRACWSAIACVLGCSTLDCNDACFASDGGALFTAVLEQGAYGCSAACGLGRAWHCANKVTWPQAKSSSFAFTGKFMDVLTLAPKPGLDVRMCALGDVSCLTPVAKATSDSAGEATLEWTLATIDEFNGYLSVASPPGASDPIADQFIFLGFPLTEPKSFPISAFTTFSKATLATLPTVLPSGSDAGGPSGHILMTAYDCWGVLAPGVAFTGTNFGGAPVVYAKGMNPDPTATETDGRGSALVLGVPAGPIQISMVPKDVGAVVGTTTGFVRENSLSVFLVMPTPLTGP
jgi:hypothetical protein